MTAVPHYAIVCNRCGDERETSRHTMQEARSDMAKWGWVHLPHYRQDLCPKCDSLDTRKRKRG